jgi:penicillin-binding protein 2
MLGLGQKTGIDLPQEVSGVMPSEEWKLKNFRQKWFAGETISVGIGQGAVATTPVQMVRAIAAISTGGHMVRPHVVFPDKVPENYRNALKYDETKEIAIDPKGLETITDAMARVLLPEGTAPSAHIPGIEIAGKTGSAQIVSLALRAKYANKSEFAQNGWFVGFTPKRNPDVVICVLFQGGEHGKLAARLATQVIKAYVDKKNHKPLEHLRPPPEVAEPGAPQVEPGTQGRNRTRKDTLEVSGLWSDPGSDHLEGARFEVKTGRQKEFHRAIAAPGMEQFARNAEQVSGKGEGELARQSPTQAKGWLGWATRDLAQRKKPAVPTMPSWREIPGVVAALPEPVWRAGEAH